MDSEQIKAVKRMQGFIEAHLAEPITLYGLARAARYSPWHAARLFKEYTGRAPFEYIRQRRLSAAADKLCAAPRKVIDVAFDFVFDSHEGFTRAFTRQFGISPRQYRQKKPSVVLFMPDRMRSYYPPNPKGTAPMKAKTEKPQSQVVFVQIVARPARKMILKRGKKATHYFEYCEELGCEIYSQLGQIKAAIHEPMGLWLPKNLQRPDTSVYAQGVEVPADYAGPVPEGFEVISLPACTMMVFQGPPFDDQNFEQAIFSLWDVMKTYQPERYGYEWADADAPRFQLEPVGYRGYIEGRPVRPVNETTRKPTRYKASAAPHPSQKKSPKSKTLRRKR
ncbi:MAG TPA: AraC family transcriptional regulator [Kiritimatiellia bacterium]|nr:AraC family transcriptional regulator [Kiritimatiellia bacterium]